jgi:hypothetical protein
MKLECLRNSRHSQLHIFITTYTLLHAASFLSFGLSVQKKLYYRQNDEKVMTGPELVDRAQMFEKVMKLFGVASIKQSPLHNLLHQEQRRARKNRGIAVL